MDSIDQSEAKSTDLCAYNTEEKPKTIKNWKKRVGMLWKKIGEGVLDKGKEMKLLKMDEGREVHLAAAKTVIRSQWCSFRLIPLQ